MDADLEQPFVNFLSASTGLPASVCHRLVLDVLANYDETIEEFVQRRHQELKNDAGLKNEEIYKKIVSEIPHRRFSAPTLTKRQVRRLIYG